MFMFGNAKVNSCDQTYFSLQVGLGTKLVKVYHYIHTYALYIYSIGEGSPDAYIKSYSDHIKKFYVLTDEGLLSRTDSILDVSVFS